MKVEMMMLMRLNCTPNRFITPRTMSQLSRMGAMPRRVWRIFIWKEKRSTRKTNAIESHWSTSKSLLIWSRVSVV